MTNAPLTPRSFNWRVFLPIALTGFAFALAISFAVRATGLSAPIRTGLGAVGLYSGLVIAQARANGAPLTRKFWTFAIPFVLIASFIQGAIATLAN